ncbi:MAG TPA: glycosyltransferase [Thermoplasmata archaeon]|nr:glycosyltransferase [Thermoplasmata archaeon]
MAARDPREEAGTDGAVRLSLVLSTLNERENLPELVDRLRRVPLPPWEALVVDDGSTDGTREFLDGLARTDVRFRPIYHDGRQTTVRAQCQGISAGRGESVVVMDADLQHPPELIPAMLAALAAGAGVVVASRYAPSGSPGPRSPLRGVLSRGAEAIARVALPDARRSTDPVSGFFAFRREVFRPLDAGVRGYKLLLFLLVMSRGQPVADVPFRFEPRTAGASKVVGGLGFVRYFLAELLRAKRLERQLWP